jgi:O-antigen ligase
MLLAGVLAGAAIVIQFVAQFAVGKETVLDWLFDVRGTFAGDRAAEVQKSNWMVEDLEVVRGVFPFMAPAGAGQFLMFSLIAGVWLRREGRGAGRPASIVELAMTLLVAVALMMTFSRQSWLGAAVGVVVLGFGRRPVQMLAVAIPVVLVLSVVPIPGAGGSFGDYLLKAGDTSTESTDTRIELWEQTIDLIPEYALIGAGPGLIGTLGPGLSDRPFYAHNVFLDSAVELGLIGVLALLAVFLAGLAAAYRNGATLALALLAAYLTAGLFDDVLFTPRMGLMLAVAFALVVAKSANAREPDPHPV